MAKLITPQEFAMAVREILNETLKDLPNARKLTLGMRNNKCIYVKGAQDIDRVIILSEWERLTDLSYEPN